MGGTQLGHLRVSVRFRGFEVLCGKSLPIGPKVVRFGGLYLEFYKVIPKGTALGPMGRFVRLGGGGGLKVLPPIRGIYWKKVGCKWLSGCLKCVSHVLRALRVKGCCVGLGFVVLEFLLVRGLGEKFRATYGQQAQQHAAGVHVPM